MRNKMDSDKNRSKAHTPQSHSAYKNNGIEQEISPSLHIMVDTIQHRHVNILKIVEGTSTQNLNVPTIENFPILLWYSSFVNDWTLS